MVLRKMKVKPFDKWIINQYGKIIAGLATGFSIIQTCLSEQNQVPALKFFLGLLLPIYIGTVIWANKRTQISLKIRNTKVVVKQGDLFRERGKKVIPVNEYFDTHVGDGIVDAKTLHGQYIKKYAQKSPDELYSDIVNALGSEDTTCIEQRKAPAKNIKYALGTIYDDNNGFLLLAYSSFDEDNRARLGRFDIAKCYMNMWDQVDIYRGSNSIIFPVLGSGGVIRFEKDFTPQQLIELMLWSFRLSGINLARNASLNIIVHDTLVNEINFVKLLDYSD